MGREHEDAAVAAVMEAPLGEQLAALEAWGLPRAGLVILMSRCLGRCFFCAQPVVTDPPASMITRWERVAAWLEDNRELGVERLCLGGTEPPTHPDFERTLVRAAEVGFSEVELMTSGVQLADPRVAERWWELGVRAVCAPLYGTTAADHDAVVRVKGHFGRVVKGLDNAAARGMTVHVHTLALRRTVHKLGDLARAARARWGARLYVAPLRPKDLFDFRAEAVALDALAAALEGADVGLVGLPACVLPDKARDAPALIAIYFRGQRTVYAPPCDGCGARARCPGVVARHHEVFGDAGLHPLGPPLPG